MPFSHRTYSTFEVGDLEDPQGFIIAGQNFKTIRHGDDIRHRKETVDFSKRKREEKDESSIVRRQIYGSQQM